MKLVAVFLLALIAVCIADDGPSKIDSNNVGDIVNVGVKAKAKIDNNIDATLISFLLRSLNRQLLSVRLPGRDNDNGIDNEKPPAFFR